MSRVSETRAGFPTRLQAEKRWESKNLYAADQNGFPMFHLLRSLNPALSRRRVSLTRLRAC